MTSSPGPIIIGLGAILIVVGLVVWAGGFHWFGRLPGDIRIERDTVHIYVPLMSGLVISIVLTVVLNLISRFF